MKLRKHYLKYPKKRRFHKHTVRLGTVGFKVCRPKRISHQKQSLLKLIVLKKTKELIGRKLKIWFFSNCTFNLTKLPLESRMGKGKGEVKNTFAFYRPGYILFELQGVSVLEAKKLLRFLNNCKNFKFDLLFNP